MPMSRLLTSPSQGHPNIPDRDDRHLRLKPSFRFVGSAAAGFAVVLLVTLALMRLVGAHAAPGTPVWRWLGQFETGANIYNITGYASPAGNPVGSSADI